MAAKCRVLPIRDRKSVDWMIREHYLGKWPGVVVGGFVLRMCDSDVGLIVFALPPRETAKRYGCETWELARLWVEDSMPRNTESWFLGQIISVLRKANRPAMLVSYADPSQNHLGRIYRATNWTYDGMTDSERKKPRFDYADAKTGKRFSRRSHVPLGTDIVRVPRVSKHRYFIRLRGSK